MKKRKLILTFIKMVRKTSFRAAMQRKRAGSTLNPAKTGGDSQPASGMGGGQGTEITTETGRVEESCQSDLGGSLPPPGWAGHG